jgi:hypothetical protein
MKTNCPSCGAFISLPAISLKPPTCAACGGSPLSRATDQETQNNPSFARLIGETVFAFTKRVIIGALSLCLLLTLLFFGLTRTEQSTSSSSSSDLIFNSSDDLNVSEPTFTSLGIRFSLNDTRPNTTLWVSVKVGRTIADKDILSWISTYGEKTGPVSVPFKVCQYTDAGITALASAAACTVTIGAKLIEGDKNVYTTFDIPVSDLRAALISAAR